jgi:hypothetical protein
LRLAFTQNPNKHILQMTFSSHFLNNLPQNDSRSVQQKFYCQTFENKKREKNHPFGHPSSFIHTCCCGSLSHNYFYECAIENGKWKFKAHKRSKIDHKIASKELLNFSYNYDKWFLDWLPHLSWKYFRNKRQFLYFTFKVHQIQNFQKIFSIENKRIKLGFMRGLFHYEIIQQLLGSAV